MRGKISDTLLVEIDQETLEVLGEKGLVTVTAGEGKRDVTIRLAKFTEAEDESVDLRGVN